MNTKQLNEAKLTTLVEYHNEIAEGAGVKTVKSFKDRETAIKRIGALKESIKLEAKKKAAAEKAAAKAEKSKKAAKGDDPLAKPPGRRGAVAKFDYEPGERQVAPRPGTLRGRAFELLQVGTTPEELEDLVVKFWKEKGLKPEDQKIGKRLRALELVRLLRYQNGYGFKQEADGSIVVIGELGGSKPTAVTKKSKKDKAKKEKKSKSDDVL
jgi:hypothetical protein